MDRFTLGASVPTFIFVVSAIAGPALAAPACGEVVGGAGAVVVLDGDVGPCDDTGGLIVADGTSVVDLGGYTVSCINASSVAAVGVDAFDVTSQLRIINGTVAGCSVGILGNPATTIERITVAGNVQVGFEGGSCLDSVASDNLVGMYLQGGVSRGCLASGNASWGFQLRDKARLLDSRATGNGAGVALAGVKTRARNVVVEGNDGTGFAMTGDKSGISECLASANNDGVVLSGHRARVARTEVTDNDSDGIRAFGRASHRIRKNRVVGNGGNGIQLHEGTATANVSAANGEFDLFDDQASCGARWRGNLFGTSNRNCIR